MGSGGTGLGSVVRKRLHALGIQWERSKTRDRILGSSGVANSMLGADRTFGRVFLFPLWSPFVPCPEAPPGHCCWETWLLCDFQGACERSKESPDPCSLHRSAHITPGMLFPSRCGWKWGWMSGGNMEFRAGAAQGQAAAPPVCTQFPKSTTVAPH